MKTQFKMGLTAAVMTLASAVLTVPGASAMVFSFGTCGGTGASGPAQAACDAAYTATTLDGDVTLAAGIQNWTVPISGLYRVTAVGAQGASADPGFVGGRGASMAGDFTFTAGDVLQILVGQSGVNSSPELNGSGGGGSFVVDSLDSPLLVAGGGGGTRISVSQNGCDASISNFGVIGSGSGVTSSCADKAVDMGLGGIVSAVSWGSGGAGFFGDGADDSPWGDGGHAWASGMTGGIAAECSGRLADGGFGGGGTGNGCGGGGGGGGYSGGDGGRVAGGGGSWNLGADQINTAGVGFGDGSVIFELLAALPEPASTALLVLGLAGIGFTRKRRA